MNDTNLTLEIEKLVYGGDGLAFHEGRPVFVPFVLPGEVIDAIPVQASRKLVRAMPANVSHPAGHRIEPACPHFTQCGGCHYQHMPYESLPAGAGQPAAAGQLQLKVDILAEQLRRLGKIEWEGEIPVHSAEPWNYRNRIQLRVVPHPAKPGILQVGYNRPGSHRLWPVDRCPISSPQLNRLIEVLNRLSAEQRLPMSLRGVEAFADDRDESLWVTLRLPGIDFDLAAVTEMFRTEVSGLLSLQYHETSTRRRTTDGLGWNYWHAGPHRWRVGHQSFFQVNRHMADKALERVTADLEGKVALDLYAGVGLFSRALADKFERVVAVEGHPPTAADLAANTADLDAVEPQTVAVAEYLEGFPEKCDAVVADPPRAGLGPKVTKALLELAPARLVYLSCDPSTLARDLANLAPDYRITSIEMLDLFPQTFHIESLVRLEREG